MSDNYKLVTGGAEAEYFDFHDTAGPGDVDRAVQEAMDSIRDEVGAVTPARIGRLNAILIARYRGENAKLKAYLAQAQAKIRSIMTDLMSRHRVPQINTLTAFNFRQLGYGAAIPQLQRQVPRSVPALIVGFSALTRTIRSIGLSNFSYASLPLVAFGDQNPTYASFGGPVLPEWVPLTFAQDEFDRACHQGCTPRFLASRLWYPTSPITLGVVQIASVGDDAIPFQDHAIGIQVVTAFTCHPDPMWEHQQRQFDGSVQVLRGQLGPFTG